MVPHVESHDQNTTTGGARAVPAAERLLLAIIDTVREPLLVLDATFRVTHANRAFLRAFQVRPEDTVGTLLFDLGDGQWDIPVLRELLLDRMAVEPELFDVEFAHVFPGIGHRIMLLNARRVERGPRAPRMVLLAFEDVTGRRSAEERLAARRVELERSNAALHDFAFIASHDLQEPLRKILSFGERLNETAGPALEGASGLYLSRMLSAASRMRTLIDALLAYSQVTMHVGPFATTDLTAVAHDVITDLDTVVAEADARIEIGALPVIEADAVQMRQLVQNLVGNAIKYRRKDTPLVVRLQPVATNNGHCTFAVADNGIGFGQEHAERIFRMFERLHGQGQYVGSGIGLSICRRIVERHGGTITASSTTGNGATFAVTLPVTQSETSVYFA